jgi:ATP-dependent RNA helicase DHX29
MLALKVLSNKLRDILSSTFKNPHKPLSPQQEEWMDIWQQIFSQSNGGGT